MMIIIDVLMGAILVGGAIIVYLDYQKRKEIKNVKELGSEHYTKRVEKVGNRYILEYATIKKEFYERLEPTSDTTTIGHDIRVAYIPFAFVRLVDLETNASHMLTVDFWELRDKMSYESIELLDEIRSNNISEYHFRSLMREVEYTNKERKLTSL